MENDCLSRCKVGGSPRQPQLDKRLKAAYDMIPACALCADIGADHGRLSAVCLLAGKVQRMLVADISAKALEKSRKLMAAWRLCDRTSFAVADGLEAIQILPEGKVDAICILGMGGETMAGILQRGKNQLGGASLVLGPQTELSLVRETLNEIGYRIRRELAVEANRRFYVLMAATPALPGETPHTRREILAGTKMLMECGPEGQAYLQRRQQLLEKAMAAMGDMPNDPVRLCRIQEELGCLTEVLSQREGI